MSTGTRPLLVAHRGGAALAPENTLSACERALRLGVDAVEIDVRLTADGVPVCLHDATVDRTTTGHGAVAALTAAELHRLDATARAPGWRGASEPPPRLADVLALVRGQARAFVELKGDPAVSPELVAAALRVILDSGMLADCRLLSFDWEALARVRAACPEAASEPLSRQRPSAAALRAAARAGHASLGLAYPALTPAVLLASHRAGLSVNVWTVNRAASIRRALRLGVDALTTDRPDVALTCLHGWHAGA